MSDAERDRSEIGDIFDAPEVSRAYRRAAREEPPPHLDDAILAAARRRAGSRPRLPGARALRRWAAPVAIAATLVVGVSVAFLAVDRPDAPLAPPAPLPELATQSESPRAVSPKSELPVPTQERERTRGDDNDRPAPSTAKTAPRAATAPAPRDARPSRERQSRDELGSAASSPPLADAPTARGAPAQRAAPMAAPPAPATELRAPEKGSAPQTGAFSDERLSPEMWLQRIREMRSRGELATAEESLQAFKRRYPDYPLPADLLPQAGVGR